MYYYLVSYLIDASLAFVVIGCGVGAVVSLIYLITYAGEDNSDKFVVSTIVITILIWVLWLFLTHPY